MRHTKQAQLIISVAGTLKKRGRDVVGNDVECMRLSERWVRDVGSITMIIPVILLFRRNLLAWFSDCLTGLVKQGAWTLATLDSE